MSARKPRAFTVVELLVVVVIIGILMALLIPAVLMARSSARRNTCMNNQHEIATALQQYETSADRLPGFVNSVGDVADGLTWAAVVTQNMGMNDVWSVLRNTKVAPLPSSTPTLPTRIPGFVCPSDGEKATSTNYPLSYVGNCGWCDPDSSSPLQLEQAIFTGTGFSAGIAVRTDEIPDGAQNTLMLSENRDATQWFATNGGGNRQPYAVDVGMLWRTDLSKSNAINWDVDHPVSVLSFPPNDSNAAVWVKYARPSSYHSGGVVATYCDGHTDFIADSIAPDVYKRLMSPNDAEATTAGYF